MCSSTTHLLRTNSSSDNFFQKRINDPPLCGYVENTDDYFFALLILPCTESRAYS